MDHPEAVDIIQHTKSWISNVVVGCNFCPFAAREMKRGSIHYEVLGGMGTNEVLDVFLKAMLQLDQNPAIETSLLILADGFEDFDEYLHLVDEAQEILEDNDYEGIYQLASFHPDYLFAGAADSDPANYTNRSPYPMLHLLRENSVTRAVDGYKEIDSIPHNNIAFATEKGLSYMQQLLASCTNS